MMTSYFFGSSIRTPPTLTNSASTPFTFIELIFSTTAGGKVFSIPNKSPIFFTIHPSSSNCHPERSNCSAKQSNYEVEGSLFTCETLSVFKERPGLCNAPMPHQHSHRFQAAGTTYDPGSNTTRIPANPAPFWYRQPSPLPFPQTPLACPHEWSNRPKSVRFVRPS